MTEEEERLKVKPPTDQKLAIGPELKSHGAAIVTGVFGATNAEKLPVIGIPEVTPVKVVTPVLVPLMVACPSKEMTPLIFAAWAVEARARTAKVAAIFDVSFI